MFNKLFKKQIKKEDAVSNFHYNVTAEMKEYLELGSITIPKIFNRFVELDELFSACVYLKKYPELNKKRSLDRDDDQFNIVLHVLLDDYKDVFLCTNYSKFELKYTQYTQMVNQLQRTIKE